MFAGIAEIIQFVQLAEGRDETFSHGTDAERESVHRAEQTVMLEEARANARRAADSWSRRSTFSGNLPSYAGMHMVTPPSERRRRAANNNNVRSPEDDRYEQVSFGNRRSNRDTTSSLDSIGIDGGDITLDVSTM